MFTSMPWGQVLAGTGHRPDKLGGYGPSPLQAAVRLEIRRRLLYYRLSCGILGIYSGMALGFDTWWAEEAVELGVPVVAAVPFIGQEGRWPRKSQAAYRRLLQRCSSVVVLRNTPPRNDRQAREWMWERDHFMVDNAWGTVACYNGDLSGGTFHTVDYARKMKKPLDIFNPKDLLAA